jgi:predicted nucleic acid-binding protein
MMTWFADTFFFIAYLSPDDDAHEHAKACFDEFDGKLLTTEWVLSELADGMANLANRETFVKFYEALRTDSDVLIVASDPALFDAGIELYAARKDKEWSLTDCISFVVMERNGIKEALTGDHHFEQAGFAIMLK